MTEYQQISDLPQGWKWVRLGDILDIQGGSQPPKSNFLYAPKEGYVQLLQIRDFGEKGVPTFVPLNRVTKFCKKDDILIARYGASLGRIVTGLEGAYNVALAKVIDEKKLFEKKYIFFLLKTQIFQAPLKLLSRSAQNGFSKSELAHINLPLPPKEVQQAIVSKIEELFSELDKGVETLRIAQQQLKTYRQSVLKWAFEGRLTNSDLKEGQLPNSWTTVSLGEICDPKRKCAYGVLVPGPDVEDGIKLLRVGDIDANGKIDQLKMKKISPAIANKFKRTFLNGGEVVISLVGAIGRTAVVPVSLKGANTARAVGVIPVSSKVSPYYVEAMLRSPMKIREHNDSSHEVARKTLNLEDVIKSRIPLPGFDEQTLIVKEIDFRFSVADKMEESIEQSLTQAEVLRQSILKMAFEGRMV